MVYKRMQKFCAFILKTQKTGAKINDTESAFQILSSGVPEGSIEGLIFFNILINDFIFFIKDVQNFANFADDNTIYAVRNSIEELIKVLEKESLSHPLTGLK